jgi:hypothetical protein
MKLNPMVLLLLIAGGSSAVAAAEEQTPAGVDAFLRICLDNAPTFANAAAAAASFGIKEFTETSVNKIGASDDGALTVQIKAGRQCVVTTPHQANPELTAQLLRAGGKQSGSAVPARVPAKLEIGGKTVIVMHDRVEGEAFLARVVGS